MLSTFLKLDSLKLPLLSPSHSIKAGCISCQAFNAAAPQPASNVALRKVLLRFL